LFEAEERCSWHKHFKFELVEWLCPKERVQAKACPGLDPGRRQVRVKKTSQINNLEPGLHGN
jgi:hypothetical protein